MDDSLLRCDDEMVHEGRASASILLSAKNMSSEVRVLEDKIDALQRSISVINNVFHYMRDNVKSRPRDVARRRREGEFSKRRRRRRRSADDDSGSSSRDLLLSSSSSLSSSEEEEEEEEEEEMGSDVPPSSHGTTTMTTTITTTIAAATASVPPFSSDDARRDGVLDRSRRDGWSSGGRTTATSSSSLSSSREAFIHRGRAILGDSDTSSDDAVSRVANRRRKKMMRGQQQHHHRGRNRKFQSPSLSLSPAPGRVQRGLDFNKINPPSSASTVDLAVGGGNVRSKLEDRPHPTADISVAPPEGADNDRQFKMTTTTPSSSPSPAIIRGIQNLGNTCCLSASLQAIFSITLGSSVVSSRQQCVADASVLSSPGQSGIIFPAPTPTGAMSDVNPLVGGPGQILGNDIANYYANNPTSQKKTGQGSRQRKNRKRTEASTNNATAPAAAAAAAAAVAATANDDDYGNDCPPTVASTTNDPVVDMDRRSRTSGISNQPWTTRGGAPASSTFNSDIPNRLARFGRSTIVTSGGESTSNDAIPIVGRELRTRPNDVEWTTHGGCLLVRTVVGGRPPCGMIAGFDLDHTLVNWTCAGWPSRPEHYELWNSTVTDECRRLHDNGYTIVIYTNQGGIKSALKGKRAKTVCGVIDWIADVVDRPVFAVVSTKKDSGYHKPSPRMWGAFETCCNGGRQAHPELSFFVGDADGSGDKDDVVVGIDPRLQRHQLTGIDKSFAKNVGEMRNMEMGFLTPGEYFGPSNAERRGQKTPMTMV